MSEMRIGIVSEQRTADGRVRVDFNDCDDQRSYWLMALQSRTHTDKHFWQPEVGEHVACMLDAQGEDGVILGAVYSQRDVPPTTDPDQMTLHFSDGGLIEYNRKSGLMRLHAAHRMVISASDTIEITASCVLIKGSPACRIGDVDNRGDVMVTGACNR